jgi:hypothetical protein
MPKHELGKIMLQLVWRSAPHRWARHHDASLKIIVENISLALIEKVPLGNLSL